MTVKLNGDGASETGPSANEPLSYAHNNDMTHINIRARLNNNNNLQTLQSHARMFVCVVSVSVNERFIA